MKKRILPIVALGVTASLALAGCAGGGSDNGTDGEGQTLSVWIMKGTNPDATAFYDEVSAAFEEETGAKVEIEEVQWADAHDR
ncbi:MAG: sugar ABC transporter substrate-binding protein, partial [Microbacterium sp.]